MLFRSVSQSRYPGVFTYDDVINMFVDEVNDFYSIGPSIYDSYKPTLRQAIGLPVTLLIEFIGQLKNIKVSNNNIDTFLKNQFDSGVEVNANK